MYLKASNTGLRCLDEGFALKPPTGAHLAVFETVCHSHADVVKTEEDYLLRVPQAVHDGVKVDKVDRVQAGAALLSQFVEAGM